jgi:AbrB family looped-hinge helix DNA binding protein
MTCQEDNDMTLMRVRAAAQLTLPADVRKALNVKEGDYLEAEIVKGGVMLKPVAVVERERAWRRIQDIGSRVKDLKPDAGESQLKKEEGIADAVVKMRRKRRKHA